MPRGRGRRLAGLVLVAVATLFSLGTFALISNLLPIPPTTDVVRGALVIDGLLLIAIVFMVGQEVWRLGRAWFEGRAAARLHLRVVALFAFIAALPAVMVAVAFTVSLNQGFDHWFESRTRQVVDNVLTVASAYMQEHARVLRADLISIATSLDAAKSLYDYEPTRFENLMRLQASLHGLQSAYLLDKNANVILRSDIDPSIKTVMPTVEAINEARKETAVLLQPGQSNQVGGLLKLRTYDDTYLYIVRLLDKQVLDNLKLARDSAMEYRELENNRSDVQLGFAIIFGGMSLVFLLGAVWVGLSFANYLVAPIRHLINAADRVAHGDLTAAVPVGATSDDISSLGASFNKMTVELRSQRQELISASEEAERRRRFTEAVLSGVSAGVVGISNDGHVTIANASALSLLGVDLFGFVGRLLVDEVPELAQLLSVALRDEDEGRSHQATIALVRGGHKSTVSVKVTPDRSQDREHGYVVTLDDISELVSAQRTSAWADVARRIAHEIKNPPDADSAQRRGVSGGGSASWWPTTTDGCSISASIPSCGRVGDIGRMVDEFSQFSRMPKAVLRGARPGRMRARGGVPAWCRPSGDRLRGASAGNAAQGAFRSSVDQPGGRQPRQECGRSDRGIARRANGRGARVDVYGREAAGFNIVEVVDTGIGLPATERHRLLEPYMTTREKGTGLGLAIVRKIVDEHGGSIDLLDSPAVADGGHGAMVRISLPTDPNRTG